MTSSSLPTPKELGLPRQFNKWRPRQDEACESMLDSKPRFLIQVCPTGFGKSVIYMTASQFYERTIILTSTKGLQTQLISDFGSMKDVVDIRGKRNYPCRLNTKVSCDIGICSFGIKCYMMDEGGCFYYDKLKEAKGARVVITNYSYWMAQNEYGEGLGKFDLLVLDEAHSSPDHVISHSSVSFNKKSKINKMLNLDGSLPNDVGTWVDWCNSKLEEAQDYMKWAKQERKEKIFVDAKRLVEKLLRLIDRLDKSWVWEDNPEEVILSPIWPAPFAEPVLFLSTPKVVLTSATVVPKTAKLLGIKDFKYEEFPHSFPIENRPLIHIPTVRMNHKNGKMEERVWISKVDSIIRDRISTKGIIHTVSYFRRNLILEKSKYREHMISHNSDNTEVVVRNFKNRSAPAILVSPSMSTGWDFPDDECRWQIIIKLPFPDTRGAIVKARAKEDEEYLAYIVMQQLIQATGRGVRNELDYCETYIIDNNIEWFLKKHKNLSVEWFHGAYKVHNTIPKPRR